MNCCIYCFAFCCYFKVSFCFQNTGSKNILCPITYVKYLCLVLDHIFRYIISMPQSCQLRYVNGHQSNCCVCIEKKFHSSHWVVLRQSYYIPIVQNIFDLPALIFFVFRLLQTEKYLNIL